MTWKNWKPIGGRILIELDKAQEETRGRIIKPQSAIDRDQHQTQEADILDVSFDAFSEAAGFGPNEKLGAGDHILIVKHGGSEVPDTDKRQRILNDKDVLAYEVRNKDV